MLRAAHAGINLVSSPATARRTWSWAPRIDLTRALCWMEAAHHRRVPQNIQVMDLFAPVGILLPKTYRELEGLLLNHSLFILLLFGLFLNWKKPSQLSHKSLA
ncbi:hypothetical protein ZWY2020_007856 [Hordeum vulgare]|nr:hypothetical protein ZWY2020_007856 [Hordeum vulgare]